MRGNQFGKLFSIVTFGESHGVALGVVLDGVPSGLSFSLNDLQSELDRRAPGKIPGTTARKEPDRPEVLSGIFNDKTLGTPIAIIVKNANQRSQDYEKLKNEYRPGHADKTYIDKYGIRDHRGGGRSSGRETLARVIGGYFASLTIPMIKVRGFITKMGPFILENKNRLNLAEDFGPYNFPNQDNDKIRDYLLDLKKHGESVGGSIGVVVENCPSGLGEPSFDKLKSDLAKSVMSIGACIGFSYGLGSKIIELKGSEVSKDQNNFGGIEGGISNGKKITMEAIFKPTSTVGNKAKQGRHDPCIMPRAIPVVEAMIKIVLADHWLRQEAYNSFRKNL